MSQSDDSTFVDGVLSQEFIPGEVYSSKTFYPITTNHITGRFLIHNSKDGTLKANKKSDKIKVKMGVFTVDERIVPLSIEIVNLNEYSGKTSFLNSTVKLNAVKGNNDSIHVNLTCYDLRLDQRHVGVKFVETHTKSLDSIFATSKPYEGIKLKDNAYWHVVFNNDDEWFGPIYFHGDAEQDKACRYIFANGDIISTDGYCYDNTVSYPWGNYTVSYPWGKWPEWKDSKRWRNYTVTFADGQKIEPSEWLSSINATDILDWSRYKSLLGESSTPTEFRDNIIAAIQYEKDKEKQKEIEETEKRLAEQRKQQEYITKYGEKYGKLVQDRKVEPGMTKQMVKEFLQEEWYTVTRTGNKEVWRLSAQKFKQSAYKDDNGIGMYFLSGMLGSSLDQLIGMRLSEFPKTIVFIGEKVTSTTI